MALTRHEQLYYNNIERIATALEKLVAQGKEDNLERFKKASNVLYGNTATVKPKSGRSDENYTYPQFVKKHYNKEAFLTTATMDEQATSTLNSFQPNITNKLDERIHEESQNVNGGEFKGWYDGLTTLEQESYARIYGND